MESGAMQPKHFLPGEGKTFKIGRMTVTFKTTAGNGWSAYTVCEAIEPPESGAGYHRHPTYDETFIVTARPESRVMPRFVRAAPAPIDGSPRQRETLSCPAR